MAEPLRKGEVVRVVKPEVDDSRWLGHVGAVVTDVASPIVIVVFRNGAKAMFEEHELERCSAVDQLADVVRETPDPRRKPPEERAELRYENSPWRNHWRDRKAREEAFRKKMLRAKYGDPELS